MYQREPWSTVTLMAVCVRTTTRHARGGARPRSVLKEWPTGATYRAGVSQDLDPFCADRQGENPVPSG